MTLSEPQKGAKSTKGVQLTLLLWLVCLFVADTLPQCGAV
jgi:hypothetical protein